MPLETPCASMPPNTESFPHVNTDVSFELKSPSRNPAQHQFIRGVLSLHGYYEIRLCMNVDVCVYVCVCILERLPGCLYGNKIV